MFCPSCKIEGKKVVMSRSEIVSHPDKVCFLCPVDGKHWEVVEKGEVAGITRRTQMKTVLICGSRDWSDREAVRSWLSKLQDWGYGTVIHGDCRGADMIADEEARAMGFVVIPFPARWKKHGRAAGPVRNQQMINEGKPDLVMYFHADLDQSKGTADMVERAEKHGVPVIAGSGK